MNRMSHVSFASLFARGFHFDVEGAAAPAESFKRLREEFSRLHTESTAVIDAAAAESRELKPEEKSANDTRFARLTKIKSLIDDQTKFASLAIQGDTARGTVVVASPDAPGREEFTASEGHSMTTKPNREEFSRALNEWAKAGVMDRKFATITTASASGALLPKVIGEPIVPTAMNTLREALALYGLKPVVTGTTADLSLPVIDASAGGEVTQTASSETENPPSIAESVILNVKTYQSKSAWFSNQQLAATDFDLLTYVQTDLAYAKDLGVESAAVAAIVADAGITQSVDTSSTTAFTYANLVALNNKLPKRYQKLKVIILSAEAYAAAESLVGDDGHPVLNKDPQNQSLLRFNGTPVLRCDYLEAFGASKVVGIVISLIAFKLRDAAQETLERYINVPGRPAQSGFNLIGFHGWGYAPSAVAKLKTPAS